MPARMGRYVRTGVREGEKLLKKEIGKSDRAQEGVRKRARCYSANSFGSNF